MAASRVPRSCFHGIDATLSLADLREGSCLGDHLGELRGRSVLIASREQLPAAAALVELDGVARRMVLSPPDLAPELLAWVVTTAEIDALVGDVEASTASALGVPWSGRIASRPAPRVVDRSASHQTEWILLTSGTTGTPRLVMHTFSSLAGALPRAGLAGGEVVWSTFYDVRRYGGLQILLRAVLGDLSLVLSSPNEPVHEFFGRARKAGVTHISGTPSHWRRALMSGAARHISPRYLRLSGEISDQALLDALRLTYPRAKVAHAFASTEAGVGFEVEDGLAGFPADLIGRSRTGIEMKVQNGTLRLRSARMATRYLGGAAGPLVGEDGFVDTGDIVELRGGRYTFVGRRGGVINVGGLKVHPEEVEAVVNSHPRVLMSLARARKSPITGAVVVADVVLAGADAEPPGGEALAREILAFCRRLLPPHKMPALLRFVPSLELSAAGKLVRPDA